MKTKPTTSFRNLYAFGKKLPVDLSLSENPLGCSPQIADVIKRTTRSDLFNYPDPDCVKLKQVISRRFGIGTGSILVANGSEAIIKLLPQALLKRGDEVIIPELTFPMMGIASIIQKRRVISSKMTSDFDIDLEDLKRRVSKKTKLIFLCNPNNPTGRVISKKKIIDFVRSTKALVVVDEANIEFGGTTVIRETTELKNLIVLRTFSKAFGLAGIRVGFCVADMEIIKSLENVIQPFPVSAISQNIAIAALNDKRFLKTTKGFMKMERDFLTSELTKRGLEVIRSKANNLLVITPASSTEFVIKLNRKGISVVDGSSFGFENSNFIRVSPRTRKINKKFIGIIDEIFKES